MKVIWRNFDKSDMLFSLADMIFPFVGNSFIAKNIGLATAGMILFCLSLDFVLMCVIKDSGLLTTIPLAILSIYVCIDDFDYVFRPMLMNAISYKWMAIIVKYADKLYVRTHQEHYPEYIMKKENVLLGLQVFSIIFNGTSMWICVDTQFSGITAAIIPNIANLARNMKRVLGVILIASFFSEVRLEFTSIYIFSCFRRQAYIVKKILKKIETLHKKTTVIHDDKLYQQSVRKYLILAIKFHQSMIRVQTHMLNEIGSDFYILFSILVPLSAATFCMAYQNMSLPSFLPVLTANLMLLFHSVVGQSCLDESSGLFTAAYFTPWHRFNKSNRTVLLIFMMNARNGIHLRKGNACLDLSSFTSVFQLSITAGLTLYQAFSGVLQK